MSGAAHTESVHVSLTIAIAILAINTLFILNKAY